MIEALLARLKGDTTLAALLGVTPADSRIHPHSVEYPGPAISYEYTDLTDDGIVNSQVTFRVTSPDYDLTAAIAKRVKSLLHVKANGSGWWYAGTTNILTCKLNGGGSLEMEDVGLYQRFLTFDVKWRDR